MSLRWGIARIAVLSSLMFWTGTAVGFDCNDCHTVHNSQDGAPMRFDLVSGEPLPLLLRGTCIECHTGLNSADTIEKPRVYSATPPSYVWGDTTGTPNTTLAGGSFYWMAQPSGDPKGHNVREINSSGLAQPPGGPNVPGGTVQLQCAGTNGCHGDTGISGDPLRSLGGAHHTNATGDAIDGTTVQTSYRFLKGVLGWEDDDWEFTSSSVDHNRYVGQDRTAQTQESATTISSFCAKCHDYFHNTNVPGFGSPGIAYAGFTSPWLRHPTDLDLSGMTGDYASYNTYDTRAPVGRTFAQLKIGANSAVGNDQGIITCLTCHRAHGSPYYASLRWNYRAWPGADPVTSTTQYGCQICHTSKN